MKDSWVTVGAFPTVVEAELAKNRLAEEGIDAQLGDGVAMTTIGTFSSTLGGVRLLVSEEFAGRAEAILLRIKRHRHSRRDDYGLAESITDVPDQVSVPVEADTSSPEDDEDDEIPQDSPKDMIVRCAWRASLFGLFLCPGLLHIFSTYSLMEIMEAKGELTTVGRSCVYGALAINALVFILLAAMGITSLFR